MRLSKFRLLSLKLSLALLGLWSSLYSRSSSYHTHSSHFCLIKIYCKIKFFHISIFEYMFIFGILVPKSKYSAILIFHLGRDIWL